MKCVEDEEKNNKQLIIMCRGEWHPKRGRRDERV